MKRIKTAQYYDSFGDQQIERDYYEFQEDNQPEVEDENANALVDALELLKLESRNFPELDAELQSIMQSENWMEQLKGFIARNFVKLVPPNTGVEDQFYASSEWGQGIEDFLRLMELYPDIVKAVF